MGVILIEDPLCTTEQFSIESTYIDLRQLILCDGEPVQYLRNLTLFTSDELGPAGRYG